MWIVFAALAIACFIAYRLISRNPGNLSTAEDLKKLNKNPQFHMEAQAEMMARQTTHFAAATAKVEAVDKINHVGERLREAEEIKVLTHDTTVLQQKATAHLTKTASVNDMDVPTFNLVRKAQEEAKVQVFRENESAKIEVWKHEQQKAIDVQARAKEVQIEVQAALTVALTDKYKLVHIQEQVLGLLEKAHAIQSGDEPQELKDAKLEVLGEVITGLRKDLRGLLQSDNG